MPTPKKKKSKTKAKAKKRKTKVKKKTRAVAKKKKATAKSRRSRPTVAKKKSAKKSVKKAPRAKSLGKVVHYYDKIGVAIVELEKPLTLGDMVLFKRGVHELTQKITSMQIEHLAVPAAKKGDVIGVKVDKEVQKGALVNPA